MDDILGLIESVIAHRIIISPEARLGQSKADKLIREIVKKIPLPVLKQTFKALFGRVHVLS